MLVVRPEPVSGLDVVALASRLGITPDQRRELEAMTLTTPKEMSDELES